MGVGVCVKILVQANTHTHTHTHLHTHRALMELYMERTHGVYIQQNESAVTWQFRDADLDFAHLQSKELGMRVRVRMCACVRACACACVRVRVRVRRISCGRLAAATLRAPVPVPPTALGAVAPGRRGGGGGAAALRRVGGRHGVSHMRSSAMAAWAEL